METSVLREKLTEYIQVADEKKVEALYTLLEEEINENAAWWKDKAFLDELDDELAKTESGEERFYTEEEANAIFHAEIIKYKTVHV